jgi:electron transfer flavoprotein alpha subunit
MPVLVIAEHENGQIKAATRSTVTAALQIGADVDVVVLGQNIGEIAKQAAAIQGVRTVLTGDDASFANVLPEAVTPTLAALAASYDSVLVAGTAFGKNLLPRLGAKLDAQPLADITAIKGGNVYERPVYAGNAIATVELKASKALLSVRGTAFTPAPASGGSAPLKSVEIVKADIRTRFVKLDASVSERPDIQAASIVVSGGRGLGSAENFQMLEKLADKLGAAIGASRAAVDAGYVPNDYQVGQTGKVVAPDLYIAIGISGAIQHLAGMKDSKVIVAINKDGDAPIFGIADYGLVGDLFQIVPELTEKL